MTIHELMRGVSNQSGEIGNYRVTHFEESLKESVLNLGKGIKPWIFSRRVESSRLKDSSKRGEGHEKEIDASFIRGNVIALD